MASRKLNQEELIKAFDKYMPKRPVYPRVAVFEEEELNNSSTESEGSDSEEEVTKRVRLRLRFTDTMSPPSMQSFIDSKCKTPSTYLTDNVQSTLEKALSKMANLKNKPKNSLEWLGYCLLNMNINDPRPSTEDHKVEEPNQVTYKINVAYRVEHAAIPVPVIVPNPMYQNSSQKSSPASVKRKHSEMGPL
uniref:BESS domain-containing protein n=1 Tax=Caenorhabditis tropicalis TaxID=1561998 RepID=A0A1I7TJU5_9PELO